MLARSRRATTTGSTSTRNWWRRAWRMSGRASSRECRYVGVLAGVVVGVVLSLIWLIYVATRPAMPLLGREPDTQVFRDLSENPRDETYDGVAVLRLDGGLFFATADALENRIRSLL